MTKEPYSQSFGSKIKNTISKIQQKYIGSETRKVGLYYSLSSFSLNFVRLAAGIITIRWVEPQQLGLWNSLLVLSSFLPLLQLGVVSGLNRELPYYLGRGEKKLVEDMSATCQFALIIAILLILIGTIISLLVGDWNTNENVVLISIVVLTSINFYLSYLNIAYRTNDLFLVLAKISNILVLFQIVTVVLPYYFGFHGYIFRLMSLAIVSVGLTYYYHPLKISPKFVVTAFTRLVKTGMLIYGLGYLLEVTSTFSRLILLYLSTTSDVGLFSPALSVYAGTAMLGTTISLFMYPKMSYNFGLNGDSRKLWPWVWKSVVVILSISLPLVIASWFLLPLLFEIVFPQYRGGLFAAKLAVISGSLESAAVVINIFATLKAWKYWIILAILKALLFSLLMYSFGNIFPPLEGVALGQLIAQFAFLIMVIYFCYRVTVLKPIILVKEENVSFK